MMANLAFAWLARWSRSLPVVLAVTDLGASASTDSMQRLAMPDRRSVAYGRFLTSYSLMDRT